MNFSIPRVMIAGTGSGCGKTSVTCAVLGALRKRGSDLSAFKCGPDYIDPMFHSRILGTESANLDSFFFPDNTLKYLLAGRGRGKDLSVIEGVMGFYDGIGMESGKASSCEIARITETPVILVIDAKGAARSVLAALQGFLTFEADPPIRGVILNRCTEMTYRMLADAVRRHFGGKILPLGYMSVMPECSLESRHLGLVTAQEVSDLREKADRLAEQAEMSIDLEGILQLGREAGELLCEPVGFPKLTEKVRIAYASDKAFCFYYADNLSALQEMGAELVPFSPLTDTSLPENIHGIYLGGGYPELWRNELSANTQMLLDVRNLLEKRIPCIAECGGFMYLTESIGNSKMVGFLPGKCCDNGKLTRFGYVRLKSDSESMLFAAGTEIPAHEFHYWDCTDPGSSLSAVKPSGRQWKCAVTGDHLYAGFPHFHFYAAPEAAIRFMQACILWKEAFHDRNDRPDGY